MINGNCLSTLLPVLELGKFDRQAYLQQVKEYQEKVGSLLYTAIMIRPDVAYAASLLSQFLTNPGPEHFSAVNWTIRYLYRTHFLALQYSKEHLDINLIIVSDASFSNNVET